MTLLELLLSLSIGMFVIALMLKLFALQESLSQEINNLSTLNRHALTTRLILTHEIKSAKTIQIINGGHEIKIDNKLFYLAKNNLYVKKDHDFAVELMPGVKNLMVMQDYSQLELSMLVYLSEEHHEVKGVYPHHRIAIHFFVKPRCTFNARNQCE